MSSKLLPSLILSLCFAGCELGYTYGYYGNRGQTVIYINQPVGGYYNSYYPNNYPNYNPYYYPYDYYPRYRCVVVPRCYPSGSCNYQNQECGYY